MFAGALEDADCPLFVISTVRSDFDRFAEDLPRLVAVRNRLGRPWTLAPIGADGLREVIEGPARLANLNVSEIKAAMVAEARMSRVPYRWSRTRYTGYGRSARAIA